MAAVLKFFTRYFPFAAIAVTSGLIYAAYIITNTSLFIFLASFLFGAVILLPLAGWLNIRNLRLERDICLICSSGEDITFSYRIINEGNLPAFSVLVFEPLGKICSGEAYSASVDYIAPRSSVSVSAVLKVSKRGLHNLGSACLASYFPFSLFFKERKYPQEGRIMVLPQQMIFSSVPFLASDRQDKGKKFFSVSEDREFAGLREHSPSDGMRMVHWPKSASMDKLIVKEFSSSRVVKALIAADCSCRGEAFEAIISAAAGVAGYCGRKGVKCALCDSSSVIEGTSEDCLKRLAVMEGGAGFGIPPAAMLKKNGVTVLFLFSSDPEIRYKELAAELQEARINFSFCFFDSSSFIPEKKRNYMNAASAENIKNEGIPVYGKGDSPESVFASSWTK